MRQAAIVAVLILGLLLRTWLNDSSYLFGAAALALILYLEDRMQRRSR